MAPLLGSMLTAAVVRLGVRLITAVVGGVAHAGGAATRDLRPAGARFSDVLGEAQRSRALAAAPAVMRHGPVPGTWTPIGRPPRP